jgi:MYXO-CTERM domain-containing protein
MRTAAVLGGSGLATLVLLFAPLAHAGEGDAGAPFGMLPIVDEITVGDPADPHPIYEDPPGATQVGMVLGQPARSMAMADAAKVFAYKIGAGKGLVAGQTYLLVVDYPEDASRQMVIVNRGNDATRTLATGQTIGDARESYTYPAPESVKYPLSGKWESYRSMFVLHERFQGVKGVRDTDKLVYPDKPADGFWVAIGQFRKKDSPLDAGASVAHIRLYAVPAPGKLDLAVNYPPSELPRRHVFWREEMADIAISSGDPQTRAFAKSIDWYDAKMKLARFLGVNTFTKDLMEFGYNQNWDSTPHGGNAWVNQGNQPELWGQIIDAATKNGMGVLPYYEYAGAKGGGTNGVASYGYQRHCRPLGDRPNDAFSDVSWSEDACIDVSDPAALDDVKNVLDATIGIFKSKASFVGAWFRTRSTNWPVSFADATLGRFGAEANAGATPTRDQLKADAALLQKYYGWWFGKRRDYLVAIRDWLRVNAAPDASVLFTSYIEEALHAPEYSDWATPTDDLPSWNTVNGTDPWKYRFNPLDWSQYVSDGKFLEMITRMKPPSADTLANHGAENDHSAPPADPGLYAAVDDVYMTMPFSRLFTVSSAAAFDAFREKSGLAIVRHFNLNEEDGQNPGGDGPMSKTLGYFVSDVDHAGPYSMLAEARAVGYGDPRFNGYLSSSNFSRGFPEYTRAFDAAFLALPALPSALQAGAAGDPEVLVRAITTPKYGTYYAVVNVGLTSKKDVKVTLAADGAVQDLVTGGAIDRTAGAATLSFFPGQLYALHVGTPVVTSSTSTGAGAGGSSGVTGAGGAGGSGGAGATNGGSSGCGCRVGGESAPSGGALVLAAGAMIRVLRRRRRGRQISA